MGCGNSGKLPHLFIPSKTAALVPDFAMEDLAFDRITTLVPRPALGQNTHDDDILILIYETAYKCVQYHHSN